MSESVFYLPNDTMLLPQDLCEMFIDLLEWVNEKLVQIGILMRSEEAEG